MTALRAVCVFGFIYTISCFNFETAKKTHTRDDNDVISCWKCNSIEDEGCAPLNKDKNSMQTCNSGEHCYIEEMIRHRRGKPTETRVERGCTNFNRASLAQLLVDGAEDITSDNCYETGCNDYEL